jgi:hypothetical protein
MTMIARIAKELIGLFVDDGSLALAILAWVGIVAALLALPVVPTVAAGPLLFAGLAAILAENVLRRARNR